MNVRKMTTALALATGLVLFGTAATVQADCTGDFNGDNLVNLSDLAHLLGYYGLASGATYEQGDLDGDGDVDLSDLAWLLGVYGTPCSPVGMVTVPAGVFQMGDVFSEGEFNERPVHAVYLDAFYIDACEVTNAQYAAALNWAYAQGGLIAVTNDVVYKYNSDTSYPYCFTTTSNSESRITWNGSTFGVVSGKENHPMLLVSWLRLGCIRQLAQRDGGQTALLRPVDLDLQLFRERLPPADGGRVGQGGWLEPGTAAAFSFRRAY